MNFIRKIIFLLTKKQKRQLVVLTAMLFIGFIFEMLGLGIIIPALTIILDSQIAVKYPSLKPVLDFFGNPTQAQLALGVMLSIVAFYIVKAFYFILMAWKQSNFSGDIYKTISRELFYGYMTQPYAFHLQNNSAILIRNITVEAGAFLAVMQAIMVLLTEATGLLGIGLILIIFEPLGTIIVLAFLIVSAYSFELITRRKLALWGSLRQEFDGKWNQQLMQTLNSVKVVRLMGRENYFDNIFSELNEGRSRVISNEYTVRQFPRFYLEVLAVLGLAGLIIVKVLQNNSLEVLIPTLGIFVTAAFRMMPSANRMMNSISGIRFYGPVVDLLNKECRLIRSSERPMLTSTKFDFDREIEIKNISFHYEGSSKKALNNISITIRKGESVGFIGTSGSGKSTMLDILLGLHIPEKGVIEVDGRNIQQNIRGWQNQIGYVPQSITLTDDTLRNNVAFGIPPAQVDEMAVKEAIRAAQLDDFVSNLPLGLETFVGEHGVRLSGGQRQRIGIARALYNNPTVLALDEATSALDTETEKIIMDTITILKRSKTILIIAHRLSTLQNCDRIFKLENGEIFETSKRDLSINIE